MERDTGSEIKFEPYDNDWRSMVAVKFFEVVRLEHGRKMVSPW